MHDTTCPPFLEELSYLSSIILSFAMIGYILLWLFFWKPDVVPVNAFVGFIAFGGVIGYCFFRLKKGLFPACGVGDERRISRVDD
jgi:hypothetical protein